MGIGPREWVLLGANLGRAIVTNGDFTAYVCDSAATRPSSQITLGRLVIIDDDDDDKNDGVAVDINAGGLA